MSGFQPKRYQQSVLDSVEAYFRACHQYGNADTAFYETTRELWTRGSKYSPIAGFEPDMPYFCLRVPTGGGKTWLAAWLCRNLPEASVTHASKQAFVIRWLQTLLTQTDYDLARANRQKFLLRNLLERRIRELRTTAVRQAYQQTLFGAGCEERVVVDDSYRFEFHPHVYAPSRDYDGRFGRFEFRKHYYGRLGDFDSKEEFDCAVWLDRQAQQGRIEFWVRNLVRKQGCSFFLQKADGRFYPDFICKRPDGVILAVEYKGADRWAAAEEDRLLGGLWEALSGGRCRFVMIRDRNWAWIDEKLAPKTPGSAGVPAGL